MRSPQIVLALVIAPWRYRADSEGLLFTEISAANEKIAVQYLRAGREGKQPFADEGWHGCTRSAVLWVVVAETYFPKFHLMNPLLMNCAC